MVSPAKWVLVTGCDSGFGSIVVTMLANKGFGVFAGHLMLESADKLRQAHSNITPVQVDITKQEPVDAAAAEINKKLSSISGAQLYGLVNNAGLLLNTGPIEWTPAANFEKMLQVNVIGAARVTNSVLPLLRKSQGRIVNVASIAGRIGLPTQSAYCASKHAMEGYSDCLRRELMDWGITVHIIEPGVFKNTNLYSTYRDGVQKLWDGIPKSVQADYGEAFKESVQELCTKGLNQYGSTDNSLVPKAMVDALTNSRPKYRYHVGADAKFLVPWFKYLNEAWQDMIFSFEKSKAPATMDPKAGARALARYNPGFTLRKLLLVLLLMWLFKKVRRGM